MSEASATSPRDVPRTAAVVHNPAIRRARVKVVSIYAVTAVLMVWMVVKTAGGNVQFQPTSPFDANQISPIDFPARTTGLACLIGVVALGVGSYVVLSWLRILFGVVAGFAFMLCFFCWAYSGQEQIAITNPLSDSLKAATPLILGALAGALCERSGVINVAIEGQFLMGAFAASVVGTLAWSPYLGMLGAVGASVLVAALLAVFSIKYQVNQVVLGVVLVVLAGGVTGFLLDQIPDNKIPDLNQPPVLSPVAIPGLAKIPVIGPAFFDQTVLIYIMYASVALVTFVLFETKWGLRVRAVGEHPTAADTVGIKVRRIRYQAVLFGGVFAGLGGAFFTVGSNGAFDKDLSAGNGFIALAALIMGRWHPIGATIASLFFGFMLQLQFQLQVLQRIPSELLAITPYVATVIAVAGFVGRVRAPAADGEPYSKS